MIPKFEIKPDDDIFEALSEQMQRTPNQLRRELRRQAQRFNRRVLKELKKPPPPVVYPIEWASDKQRKAFFASNGFGAGIPTQRTGKLQDSWQASYSESNGIFTNTIENTDPKAEFVIGENMQPFHINTGWEYAPDVLEPAEKQYQDILIDTFFTFADPGAGVF